MAFKIKTVTVAAGATVGVFSASGATVAASYISFRFPNYSNFVLVAASDGSGDTFRPNDTMEVGASEIYVKNTGADSADFTVMIIPVT